METMLLNQTQLRWSARNLVIWSMIRVGCYFKLFWTLTRQNLNNLMNWPKTKHSPREETNLFWDQPKERPNLFRAQSREELVFLKLNQENTHSFIDNYILDLIFPTPTRCMKVLQRLTIFLLILMSCKRSYVKVI
jgi:hypothetical protein